MRYQLPVNIHSYDPYIFENDYIFILHQSDGWTRRLMHTDLIVNSANEYLLEMHSYEEQISTGKPFSIFISGRLPFSMKKKIDFLSSPERNKFTISGYYGKMAEDISTTSVKIKRKDKIIETTFGWGYDMEKYSKQFNYAEKELLALIEEIYDWLEKIYKAHLAL